MSYLGVIKSKKIDHKRRLSFPAKWIDDTNSFFWVEEDDTITLYPEKKWNGIRDSITNEKERIEFSSNSVHLTLDHEKRILLPKTFTAREIDLVGMTTYIVVRESG